MAVVRDERDGRLQAVNEKHLFHSAEFKIYNHHKQLGLAHC